MFSVVGQVPEGVNPIERRTVANPFQIPELASAFGAYDPRRIRHPVTDREYLHTDFFSHPRRIRGVVEAVDTKTAQLVVVRRGLGKIFDRYWVASHYGTDRVIDLALGEKAKP